MWAFTGGSREKAVEEPRCGKAYQVRTSKDVPQSNTTTGIRNIAWLETEKRYRVSVTRHGKTFSERTDTLEEAIECKKRLVREAEEYFGERIYKE